MKYTNVIYSIFFQNVPYQCSRVSEAGLIVTLDFKPPGVWVGIMPYDEHPSCWSSFTGALIPGPYGQCMTQVARGDIGPKFKILREPMCNFLEDLNRLYIMYVCMSFSVSVSLSVCQCLCLCVV